MDYKPQRSRALRVFDENMPINPVPRKALHRSFKSTSALTTKNNSFDSVVSVQPKRSALGDVSNVNSNYLSKNASKAKIVVEQLPVAPLTKSVSVLDKPPQRPRSQTAVRGKGLPAILVEESYHKAPKAEIFQDVLPQPALEQEEHVLPVVESLAVEQTELQPSVVEDAPHTMPSFSPDEVAPEVIEDLLNIASFIPDAYIHEEESAPSFYDAVEIPHELKPVVPAEMDAGAVEAPADHVEAIIQEVATVPALSTIEVNVDAPLEFVPQPMVDLKTSTISSAPGLEDSEYDTEDSVIGPDREDDSLKSLAPGRKSNTYDWTTQCNLLVPRHTRATRKELEFAKQHVLSQLTLDEIAEEKRDTNMVAPITEEIFEYYRELENKLLPNKHYMEIQTELQWSMRSVLVDWLVQVHERLMLLPETLFLAVYCIDRFLSVKVISVGKLQLVGAVAILIAAKYEEVTVPRIDEIVFMVDNGFTAQEIVKAERFMLQMLGWELGWPGPMSFLRRISKADDYDYDSRTLSKYLLETTIMDEAFIGLVPSFLAAGCHCLSRILLRKGPWTLHHVHYSGYTYAQLHPLVSLMVAILEFPLEHHPSVFEKYTQRRFKKASLFVQEEIQKGVFVPDVLNYSMGADEGIKF